MKNCCFSSKKKTWLLFFGIFFLSVTCRPQSPSTERMQWFADAKLGIFIHWGIYSVQGTSESWAFHNKRISHDDYLKQIGGFTASDYDPKAWAVLVRRSGARYAVITSKHHDGVALWDTKMNDLSIPRQSPARRDVLTPFIDELRKAGIKTGLYYSLIDWSYPDYPGFLRDSSRYDAKQDPARWNRFLSFYQGQMDELLQLINPDLWWFDGDWEHSAEEWQAEKLRKTILDHNPRAIINGRLQGFGDYETPEQNFPVSRPDFDYWELCMTTNDSWGWQPRDTAFKTPYEVISIFADAISHGGNLLLDIGPREDGFIPEEQVNILTELGNWTSKHEEAIFNTLAGVPLGHFYGPTTISKDSTSVFLFLAGNPIGQVVIKGLFNDIRNISVVGQDRPVDWKMVGKISWSAVPGLVYIDVPENFSDKYMTVLKVELDGPLRLYRGKGGLGL
ncbi:MAG: alpha-L-fucosidase [Bacteroidales bacterium]|nr:alpha-L-fucosidase [Bacteroidales bacterium]